MKLNVAAVLVLSSILLLASPGVAFALDGIDLSNPPEIVEVEEGACSRLVQIKYPFLVCRSGEIGLAEGDDTWDSSRQIPDLSDWTAGPGYWGHDLNQM